ncbi:MAG: hypothetical protein EP343_28805 [Deltaproteobacteria bacterium]|nr:MAG: hypothetical protein EP343_28805 [Deltaproteobacteria bacterium]
MSSEQPHLSLSSYKRQANLLQRDLSSEEPSTQQAAFQRLAILKQFSDLSSLTSDRLDQIQHKHLLQVVAKEAGFASWVALKRHLDAKEGEGEKADEPDWETFFGSPCGFLNHWFPNYEAAKAFRDQEGGYLFSYKTHCLVAGEGMIASLGCDPHDPDWERVGFDWVEPGCPHAWHRLKAQMVKAWRKRQC